MTLPNSSSINAYGSGVLVDAVPLVDPTSEMGAAALNPLRNDVAAMTTTAPRCIFQFTGGIQSDNHPTSSATWVSGCDTVWGNAAPVQPSITWVSTGTYSIQLPSTVSDQIGNSNLVNVRFAIVQLANLFSFPGVFIVQINSASTFTIKCYKLDGSLNDFESFLLSVVVF